MKILPSKLNGTRGSTLFIILIVTGLVGFTLAAYLTLLRRQNTSTMRSQSWNATVPVVEAGVEDALSQLNAHGSTNLNCDGWTQSGTLYYKQWAVGGNIYFVTISNFVVGASNNFPVIESRGYVNMPILVSSAGQPFLASIPGGGVAGSNCLVRGVRCATKPEFLYAKGVVAKGQIDLNGNNVASDSFDSSNTNYNTGGVYDPSKRKAGGDIATNSGLTNSLSVGNANVWGHVSTGPGGSVSIGPNGTVGDAAWHLSNTNGIEPGFSTDDMNVDFPDVKAPFAGGFGLSSGLYNATLYDYVLTSGNYQVSSVSWSSNKKMVVTGNATLYVTSSSSTAFSMSGANSIEIAPGASLKLYVSASTASLGGNGVINDSGNASNFAYYGLPSNTNLSLSGNAAFTGTIYAPSAAFTMNGGGTSSTNDFTGASITKTVRFNGHYNFHYDEALGKYGPPRGYVVTSWNEMTPGEVNTLPLGLTLTLQ